MRRATGHKWLLLVGLALGRLAVAASSAGLDAAAVKALASEESAEKVRAIDALVASGNPAALPVLEGLERGELKVTDDGRVWLLRGGTTVDAATGESVTAAPASAQRIGINNRVRRALDVGIAVFKLSSKSTGERLKAAEELQSRAHPELLPVIQQAIAREEDPQVKDLLRQVEAAIQLSSPDAKVRLAAVRVLGQSDRASTKALLAPLLEKRDGQWAEPDAPVRAEAQSALRAIDRRLTFGEMLAGMFSGLSLGSVLLLASLGLAITYGLLGVINMAHGEMLMIGAYATYVTQLVFRRYFPSLFDWYLVFALPVAFVASGAVGMILERTVIRYLYGRPLETLLATWGIGLVLIQGVRALFGAQNVQVANPYWMSGGLHLTPAQVLPYNRLVIIGFSLAVLALVWLALNRTRLGLHVRAVTQNRRMADCVGVPVEKVDLLAFGLGSAIAGLGGCALTQIANVGPELGQGYIVDSFMVVVLGGVGQLAGTVYASLGLGVVDKLIEPFAGAVLAKIMVLAFIVVFIQRRPQGLFALKGRLGET